MVKIWSNGALIGVLEDLGSGERGGDSPYPSPLVNASGAGTCMVIKWNTFHIDYEGLFSLNLLAFV